MKTESPDIDAYNAQQPDAVRALCDTLRREFDQALPDATSKVWHGSPVWFLDGNPVVGYAKRKGPIQVLFWSGRTFDEPGLVPEGTFQAAHKLIEAGEDLDLTALRRWLQKARDIQWDYKNIVKRKGVLVRLR